MQLPQISRPTFNRLRAAAASVLHHIKKTSSLQRRRNLFLSSPTGEDAAFVALAIKRLPAVAASGRSSASSR